MINKLSKSFLIFLALFFCGANNVISQCSNFTISLGQNQSYCIGQNVTLSANIIDTSGLRPTISWSHNGTTLSDTTATISLALSSTKTGTYIVTVTIDTCLEKDTVLLGLLDPGQINEGQVICFNQIPSPFTSVSLANIITGDTLNYVWESSLDSLNWASISSANLASFSADTLSQSTYFRRKVQIIKNGVVFCDSFSNTLFVEVVSGVSISAGFDTIVCPNNSFTFSGSITGIGSYQPTYLWSGPGGFSDTTLTPTISSVSQSDAGTYVLSATIGSCVLYDTVVLGVYIVDITFPPLAPYNFNNGVITRCGIPAGDTGTIGFYLDLPSPISVVDSIIINFGNGISVTYYPGSFNGLKLQSYQAGFYTLSVLFYFNTGCNSVISYPVFVGDNPATGNISLNANYSRGCLPHTAKFTFNAPTLQNINGTTYIIDWGDGSSLETYTHPFAPDSLSHIYTSSSCGNLISQSGSQNIYNAFRTKVRTENPCGVQESLSNTIYISDPPLASFTTSKKIICPNDTIQFINTTDYGLAIPPPNSGSDCDTFSPFYWTITPSNSSSYFRWTTINGSLGSNNGQTEFYLWTIGTNSPSIQFLSSGTYIINLFVGSGCGLSQYSDTICVIVPPVCFIDITDTAGCSVLNTGVSSSSVLPTCDSFDLPVQYSWSVSNPSGCSGCSSSLANNSSDSTGVTLVNNSNSIQYFTVELTVTAIDSNTNSLLSNCESTCSRTIKVYPRIQISPLTSCTGQLNWNLTNQVNVPSNFTWRATQNPNVSGETTSWQTSNLITDSLVNNSTTSQTVIYTVIANSIDGGCSDTQTFTVNLLAPIVVQPFQDDSICVGGTLVNPLTLNYTGGTNPPTYQWKMGGVILSNSASFTPNNFNAPGSYSFIGSVTYGPAGCRLSDSDTATITVFPDPVVTIQPVSDTYCLGALGVDTLVVSASGGLGSYSYQWYSNTINSVSGGIAISGANNSNYLPLVGIIGTTYYYCVISQSGLNCEVTSIPIAIVVTPAPTFSTNPDSLQIVCLDGSLSALTVAYQNGVGIPTYQWFVNTSNSYSAAVPIVGATNATYAPPSNNVGTLYYYCVVSLSKGGCSSIVSNIAKVIVNPDPIITTHPLSNQSICVGGSIGTPFFVNYSGGLGTPSYQWQRNGINLLGDTNALFLPTSFFSTDTVSFNVVISLSGNGCDLDTSLNAIVIVVDDPIIVQQPDSAIYCKNTSPVAPLKVRASAGIGTFNFQWYSNLVNSNFGGVTIPGATDSTFTPPVNIMGTVYYYCEVSQTGLNCDITSAAAKITTTPSPSFSNQPIGLQKLCVGGTPSLLSVSYVGGNNSASYQWYQNNVNSNIGGLPIVGAISNSYLPATTVSGVTYYYCVVSFSIGGCSAITSNTAEVEVLDDPVITNHPLFSQMICEGTTIGQPLTFSYTGGSGATSIAWYQTGSPDILINGISDTSFQPIIFTTTGTYKYYAVLTDSGKGCNNVNTLLGEIIVNPTPYVNLLNDTVLCNDSKLNINITTTIPSNITWSATPNNNVTGELTSIQTSFLIDDSLTNNTSVSQFVNYTITPNSFPHGCPGPDSNVMVKVQPDVILSNIPNVEICSGSPVNAILTANIPSTFNWFVSLDNPNVTGESLLPSTSNLITDRLVNNTNINQIVVYSVFLVSIDGSCPGIAQTFVVTVKPSIDLLNEDTLTICSGTKVNLSLVANTNVTFNWYADQSVNVLNETTTVVSSSLINDSLVNLTNSVQQVTYRVVGTSTSNGCSSPVIPVTVFVNPIPTADIINDTLVCNNTTLSPISFNGPVIGTIYNWYTFDTTIGVGASSGINSIPGFITTNNTMGVKNSTFTLTPIFINDSVSCSGPSQSFVISVLPSPDVYLLSDISVCNGIQVPQKIVAGSISGTIFNWQNSNTAISLNSSGIGNVPSFNATNLTAVQQFSSVSVTPMIQQSGIQCFGAIESYLITVNSSPQVQNSNIEICNGENTNILLNANIPSSFAWYATSTPLVFNETSFPIQTSVLINDNLSITSPLPQTVDYHVIPTSLPYGCSGPDSIIKVTVNPLPDVSFNILNTIFCDLQPINFQNTSVGSLNFHWDFGDGDTSFLFNPSHTYASPGNYTIKLVANNPLTGCSDSSFKSIVISKTPNSNFSYSDSVGCDILDVLFTADTIDLTATYLWDFGNGNISQQIGFSGHQYLIPDCYDVSLTVTSKEGCVSSSLDTSAICLYEQPIADFIADRVLFSSLEVPEVKFTNLSQFSTFYLWNFGDGQFNITENPVHRYSPGANIYTVKLISSNNIGCQDSITKTIKVYQDIAIYIPNTFTPNRDQINQVFLPILTEGFVKETYRLTIFNRWGELIFQTRDVNEGWDGLHNGKLCQIDSYIWKIYVEVANSSEVKSYTGHVNLIR